MENTTQNNQTTPKHEVAPDNNLVWAILSTILCCWPFGIPAIVHAAKVDKYWLAGHKEQAIKAANEAKKWAKISAFVAAGCWALYLIFVVILGVFAAGLEY